jgi:hypothetical protein
VSCVVWWPRLNKTGLVRMDANELNNIFKSFNEPIPSGLSLKELSKRFFISADEARIRLAFHDAVCPRCHKYPTLDNKFLQEERLCQNCFKLKKKRGW